MPASMFRRFDNCIKGLFEAVPALPGKHRAVPAMVLPAQAELDRVIRRSPNPRLPRAAETVAVCLSRACAEPDAGTIHVCGPQQLAPIGLSISVRACARRCYLPVPIQPPTIACRLATITIRKRDCKIIRVCNWSARKFATTFPNLQYWFSFLPFTRHYEKRSRLSAAGHFEVLKADSSPLPQEPTDDLPRSGEVPWKSVPSRNFPGWY